MKITLNLEEVWSGNDWDETVAEIIRDELKNALKLEIRKALKDEKVATQVIASVKADWIDKVLGK